MLPMPVLESAPHPVQRKTVFQQYREQQVLSASPIQLVLMTYEVAIVSCEAQNGPRASQALTELIGALNFDAGEVAVGLFRLYEYCLREVRRQHFSSALGILRDLKAAWEEALRVPRS
jgi:flagellin-specific chaperone FliS